MKRLLLAVFVLAVLAAVPALAQNPATARLALKPDLSAGEVSPTPEMWFYEQYRSDYLDPKMAVRQKAEFRAAQRQKRMAALKWFGFSNQRPRASSDPIHGDYSPMWSSNNPARPLQWSGVGHSWVPTREATASGSSY